jgi:hypothetical protein
MGDQQGLRDKKQKYREQPKPHMRRAGLHGSAKEIWNYDAQNLGKDEVRETEFFAQQGAARFEPRFCRGKLSAKASGQSGNASGAFYGLCRQPELQALVCLWYGGEAITIAMKRQANESKF